MCCCHTIQHRAVLITTAAAAATTTKYKPGNNSAVNQLAISTVRHGYFHSQQKHKRVASSRERQTDRQTERPRHTDLVIFIATREYNGVGTVTVSAMNTSNMRTMYTCLTHLHMDRNMQNSQEFTTTHGQTHTQR